MHACFTVFALCLLAACLLAAVAKWYFPDRPQ